MVLRFQGNPAKLIVDLDYAANITIGSNVTIKAESAVTSLLEGVRATSNSPVALQVSL